MRRSLAQANNQNHENLVQAKLKRIKTTAKGVAAIEAPRGTLLQLIK